MQSLELSNRLNTLLEIEKFPKDCHENGWQIEGKKEISHIAFAVSPTLAIIEQAIEQGCDALITHHGLYWKGQQVCATGLLGKRLQKMVKHSLNLFSYHLPLDCHPNFGNNAQIGQLLSLEKREVITGIQPFGLLHTGLHRGSRESLMASITQLHGEHVRVYQFSNKVENLQVNWCSGAGGDLLEKSPCDIFITGEISERHYSMAQELGVTLVQAGHWATEIWGVKALAQWAEEHLNIQATFLNTYNPI